MAGKKRVPKFGEAALNAWASMVQSLDFGMVSSSESEEQSQWKRVCVWRR